MPRCQHQWWCQGVVTRVSYRGVRALDFPSPRLARNLENDYGYYCGGINVSYLHVTGHPCQFVPGCVRSNLRGAKFKIFPGGVCPQTSLVATHTYTRYYHPSTIVFPHPPPNSKSCIKPLVTPIGTVVRGMTGIKK